MLCLALVKGYFIHYLRCFVANYATGCCIVGVVRYQTWTVLDQVWYLNTSSLGFVNTGLWGYARINVCLMCLLPMFGTAGAFRVWVQNGVNVYKNKSSLSRLF